MPHLTAGCPNPVAWRLEDVGYVRLCHADKDMIKPLSPGKQARAHRNYSQAEPDLTAYGGPE